MNENKIKDSINEEISVINNKINEINNKNGEE